MPMKHKQFENQQHMALEKPLIYSVRNDVNAVSVIEEEQYHDYNKLLILPNGDKLHGEFLAEIQKYMENDHTKLQHFVTVSIDKINKNIKIMLLPIVESA
jgi:hypothetical protein